MQHPIQTTREDAREQDGQVEGHRLFGYAVGDIHAKKRRDQGRHHQNNGDDGEPVDHLIQVIGYDAGIGIHGAIQDVRIDI